MHSSYVSKLKELQRYYGKCVICDNGLYHIYNAEGEELYINPATNRIDGRSLYKTEAVLSGIIVAKTISSKHTKFVVLSKTTLEVLLKTKFEVVCVDDNIIYTVGGSKQYIMSAYGNKLLETADLRSIIEIGKCVYIVKSYNMYSDAVMYYNQRLDRLRCLVGSEGRYIIDVSSVNQNEIFITEMNNVEYVYDTANHILINKFSGEQVKTSITSFNNYIA